MPASAGMRFSRFELVSRIGAGGMGEVWRARDNDLRSDVGVAFVLARIQDRDQVGMVEGAGRAGLVLEATQAIRIGGVVGRQDLDRDLA